MKTILHVISTAMLVCLLVFPCAARAQSNNNADGLAAIEIGHCGIGAGLRKRRHWR